MEIEAKFIVDGGLQQAKMLLMKKYPDAEYLGIIELPAIYYDTKDGKLEQNKAALRVREEKGRMIGCFKATSAEERKFVEEEIVLEKVDIHRAWYSSLQNYAEILYMTQGQEILPLVKIETERSVFLLGVRGLKLEVVFDLVSYMDGLAIEERIEVELKEGDPETFAAFLEEFTVKMGGLQETKISKYQKAKELLRNSV